MALFAWPVYQGPQGGASESRVGTQALSVWKQMGRRREEIEVRIGNKGSAFRLPYSGGSSDIKGEISLFQSVSNQSHFFHHGHLPLKSGFQITSSMEVDDEQPQYNSWLTATPEFERSTAQMAPTGQIHLITQ